MSINNPVFNKPPTQIFTQQPNYIIDSNILLSPFNEFVSNGKPIAYVLPIESPHSKDKSVQTDSLFNDLSDVWDFERSRRMHGTLENTRCTSESNSSEVTLLCGRVKILQQALDEQRTRNDEVKKLLMASLGDDMASHFTQLMSDLSSTGERVSSLICEKRIINDNVDQLSIEADLWKKKFVAGRILVNELADWKQQFALRYQESLDAIHNLLQERQTIRVHLSMINDQLMYTSSHLGRNHSNRYCSNTMDLVKQSLDIATEVNYLLSSGVSWDEAFVTKHRSKEITEYTSGEEGALEVLKNRPNMSSDKSTRYITSLSAKDEQHLEEMTLSICRNCRGDLFVV